MALAEKTFSEAGPSPDGGVPEAGALLLALVLFALFVARLRRRDSMRL